MSDPRLFFCLGATKAGTSWLYEALRAHPQVHLRSIKELHYFNALEGDRLLRQAEKHREEAARLSARIPGAPAGKIPGLSARVADRAAWLRVLERPGDAAYLDYLTSGRGDRTLVGDVTPAYGLLPAGRLAAMAALMPDTRMIYILRDPVARLWSHVRMMATRRGGAEGATPDRADRILRRTIKGKEPEIARRGDYADVMDRLAAVPARQVLRTYYEDMIAPGGLERTCAFLGIDAVAADTARRVHAGPALQMTSDQHRAAQRWLAPQYAYIAREMGPLPPAWQRNLEEV